MSYGSHWKKVVSNQSPLTRKEARPHTQRPWNLREAGERQGHTVSCRENGAPDKGRGGFPLRQKRMIKTSTVATEARKDEGWKLAMGFGHEAFSVNPKMRSFRSGWEAEPGFYGQGDGKGKWTDRTAAGQV